MIGRPPRLLLAALLPVLATCQRPGTGRPAGGQPVTAPAMVQAAAPAAAQAKVPPSVPGQLAHVRPPPPPCSTTRGLGLQLLVSKAAAAFDAGEPGRALACADEALRASPRLVPALHYRAAALAALGRTDEARLAFATVLAVDPDDPEALLGAAELYVQGAARAEQALGLEYALRGARVAQRARRGDRDLASRLLVIAAGAENDLGDSAGALSHADQALALTPAETDALYERGVALYELCRFVEARAALERVQAAEPDDAWTLHYLALVAERMGRGAHADELERRARALEPEAFPAPVDIDGASFEREVREAVAALPEPERRVLTRVPVEVQDVPDLEDLTAVEPPLSPSILGLFRGPPEREACLPQDGARCRSIVFYRRNLARYARSRAELQEQVRVTLLHELGHLHGETDDDLRARGLE